MAVAGKTSGTENLTFVRWVFDLYNQIRGIRLFVLSKLFLCAGLSNTIFKDTRIQNSFT